MNVVFRTDSVVLRVSPRDVAVREVMLVAWLADNGIPVLRPLAEPVVVDDVAVTVSEFVESREPIDYRGLGAAVRALHRLDSTSVPERVALPWCGDASWLALPTNLDRAIEVGVVADRDIAVLRAAVAEVAHWQDVAREQSLVLCHGDVHPQNVLMRGHEVVVIDWDSICIGPAAWGHGALLTWSDRWGGDPSTYPAFAAGYGEDYRSSHVAQLLADVRLLAPTINMIVKGATSSRHADEARLRMQYWRGEHTPAVWTPQ